jgi:serine/threonine protein kinase
MLGEEGARTDRDSEGTATSHHNAGVDAKPLELVVGKAVGGTDWVLEGTLGRGGMAVVLAVVKELAGIKGAMKIPHAELLTRKGLGLRFLDEARLYTSLKHPHIVSVIDCGVLGDGTPFMVMERLRGRTLRDVMRGSRGGGRKLRAAIAYEIVTALCDALHRLHSHRPVAVVHRDVKPENIFIHEVEGVAGRGTVKLLDLGLAGQAGLRRKVVAGTPRYMAPEQIRGQGVTAHTDQYAVGLVLYEMLSGRFPWNVDVADVEAMIEVHLKKAPLPLSEFCPWVPESVNQALLAALAKDPAKRLPTIMDLSYAIADLESVKDGPDPDADVCITAPTAPTLASLAAYDSGASSHSASEPRAEQVDRAPADERGSDSAPQDESVSTDQDTIREIDSLLRGLGESDPDAEIDGGRFRADAVTAPESAAAKRRQLEATTRPEPRIRTARTSTHDDDSSPVAPPEHARVPAPESSANQAPALEDLRSEAPVANPPRRPGMSRRVLTGATSLGFCLGLGVALLLFANWKAKHAEALSRPTAVENAARDAPGTRAPEMIGGVAPAALSTVAPDPGVFDGVGPTMHPSEAVSSPRVMPSPVKSNRATDRGARPAQKAHGATPSIDDGREFFLGQ